MNTFIESMITNLVSSKIQGIATKMGVSDSMAKQVAIIAVPLIINYLTKNTDTAEAKQGLIKATQDPRNTIDQNPDTIDLGDAAKMLGHIFGGDKEKIVGKLSEKTGLESNQASDIVGMLAKYVVGGLGEQQKQENLDDNGVVDLLGKANSLINGSSSSHTSDTESSGTISDLLGSFLNGSLDKNNDGAIQDDLIKQGAQLLMGKLLK